MGRPYHYFKYNKRSEESFTNIAHRGASAYYPENTLAAFEGAIKLGADMVELDVQLSRDGEVVVFHDEKINRCTDSRGVVSSLSLVELKRLDAGGWFDKKFKGEKIPTLKEVLNICRDKIAVNIEIKTEAVTDKVAGGIEEKCLKIVEQSSMKNHIIFSSFDPRAIKHLREINHSAAVAVLFEKKYYDKKLPAKIVSLFDADCFNCSHKELKAKWLENLKENNISVNVYTVDDEKNQRRLLKAGVEGIFTNKPDILKKTADDFFRQSK
jgi:glycerophosphoryl diester phosphodiesterase